MPRSLKVKQTLKPYKTYVEDEISSFLTNFDGSKEEWGKRDLNKEHKSDKENQICKIWRGVVRGMIYYTFKGVMLTNFEDGNFVDKEGEGRILPRPSDLVSSKI